MEENTAIKIDNVSKDFHLPDEKLSSVKSHIVHPFKRRNYKVQHALQDISLDIKEGEFFGIVGRNGSGKSTLLKIIAGIYQPTKGKVSVNGKLVPFIELGVGFNPELTGRENVYLNGALLGFSKKEIDDQYHDIVRFAELKRFMNQKLKNYSSGMQVRLAFSMAVRANADILLIDEVLAVGDADFQRKCFDYFRTLKRDKKTVVFVSHNMDAVREYCDRAVLIEKNKVVAAGLPGEIAIQYTKLFSEKPAVQGHKPPESKRWGEQTGMIKKVEVPSKITKQAKEFEIKLSIEGTEDLDSPIIGYTIKDSTGTGLTGANTKTLKVNTSTYPANKLFTVGFTIDNVFSDGIYYADVAIIASDGVTILDWWDSANQFTVFEDPPSPYPISPAVEVEIKKS